MSKLNTPKYALTVAMTPTFYTAGDKLFRAQLRCLSEQEFKDFDVLLIDSHYQKRKGYINELAEKYKLNLVHVPYTPNLGVAKLLDCAIFNAPYCFSESPKIVRYSCWRFVRPSFTRICVESKIPVDFYFHNVAPPEPHWAHPESHHNTLVWSGNDDVVNWSPNAMPSNARSPGAQWGSWDDNDSRPMPFPLSACGNYMIPRETWLNLNGCDEAIFSSEHWEDQDFCLRAQLAGLTAWRKAHVMYRMHHVYGGHSGRANIEPDFGKFRELCDECKSAEHIQKPNRRRLRERIARKSLWSDGRVWVCPTCFYCGPVFHADEGEYAQQTRSLKKTCSNIIPQFRLGRNLRRLVDDMDGKSLAEKCEIYAKSWHDSRYYV